MSESRAFPTQQSIPIEVGGICPRGSGHTWTYEDDDGSCGSKSWTMRIDVDPSDFPNLPQWVQELVPDDWATGRYHYFYEANDHPQEEVTRERYLEICGNVESESVFSFDGWSAWRVWMTDGDRV